jgi:hypothetical protein
MPLATIACEYGPIAAGALSELITRLTVMVVSIPAA